MDSDNLNQLISLISKGDTSAVESLFSKPSGRKYLETVVLIVINTMTTSDEEKEELFNAFRRALNTIEKRIRRQHEGQQILDQLDNNE